MNTTPTPATGRENALEKRIAVVRASRDSAAWNSAKALLRPNMSAALDWAEMADIDNHEMNALNDELRALRKDQA